jgi:hypothetical protein
LYRIDFAAGFNNRSEPAVRQVKKKCCRQISAPIDQVAAGACVNNPLSKTTDLWQRCPKLLALAALLSSIVPKKFSRREKSMYKIILIIKAERRIV